MTPNQLHVFVDLDDTLISTQAIFEEVKNNCATSIQKHITAHHIPTVAAILETFNTFERKLIATHGLRNSRFIMSWVETLRFYAGADKEKEQDIRHMASRVFRTSAKRFADAVPVLEALRGQGYALHLLTSGEEGTQRYRVADAELADYFASITVVLEKTPQTYKRVVLDPKNSVMIGNSVTADINPSLEIGMFAIQVEEGNNWFFDLEEEIESDRKRKGMLKDVPRLVKELEESRKMVRV